MFDPTHYRKNFLRQRQYFRLIADLKLMIDSSQAEVRDLTQDRDLLSCIGCGAVEKIDVDLSLDKVNRDARILPPGSFIVIEAKQKKVYPAVNSQKINIYTYICPLCGLYQNGLVRCKSM